MVIVGSDVGLLTAGLSFAAATLGVWNNRRIDTVHKLVNQNHQDEVARVDQLTSALTKADVPVPPNGKGGEH
jgi:hypothetical protein